MRRRMLETGATVDRYRIEGVIGRGGMADVYRVQHTRLGTPHALKVLRVPLPGVRLRLEQEGRIQASLRHPNVVTVTDLVEVAGAPGLIMEWVDGVSLDRVLGGHGPLADAVVDCLACDVLAGVAAAHERGLIHRDLKPQNVLVGRTSLGVVAKVTDFGLARLVEGGDPGARHTAHGATFGTPGYMAPEQFGATRDVDARADVFGLGALLYELVTGRCAFAGADTFELLAAAREGRFEPLESLAPRLAPHRAALITRCLAPDPSARPSDARAVAAAWGPSEGGRHALDGLLDALPVGVVETSHGSPGTWTDSHASTAPEAPPQGATPSVPAAPAAPPGVSRWRRPGRARARWLGAIVILALVIVALATRPGASPEPEPVDPAARARVAAALPELLPGVSSPWLLDAAARALPGAESRAPAFLARADLLRDLARRIAAAGLPRAVLGVPAAESGLDAAATSRVCAAGLWQFMPETAVNLGLRVESCTIRGVDLPWTPTPGMTAGPQSPYFSKDGCPLSGCAVDERRDDDLATEAALRLMVEATGLSEVAVHPQRSVAPLISFSSGNAVLLETFGGRSFDPIVVLERCATESCDPGQAWAAEALSLYVAHAMVASCVMGPERAPWCGALPVADRPSLAGWLADHPGEIAFAPLDCTAADTALARALDDELRRRLTTGGHARAVDPLDPVGEVLGGRLRQIGSHVWLELSRTQGSTVVATGSREAETPEGLLPHLDDLLFEVLSAPGAAAPDGGRVDPNRAAAGP